MLLSWSAAVSMQQGVEHALLNLQSSLHVQGSVCA